MSAEALPPEHRERLLAYARRLLEVNRSVNLTGAKSLEDLLDHIHDSLSIAPYVRSPHVDIGSGGGLPAIPLAIITGATITLVESVVKKAKFLEQMFAELEINGRVIADRAEVAARDPELREAFESATARAVSSAPTVAELTTPFLKIGGRAILQRGSMDARERHALADAASMLGAEVEEEVPQEGDRRIVLVRKTGATPPRFPRRLA